jgi:hypothetical protein
MSIEMAVVTLVVLNSITMWLWARAFDKEVDRLHKKLGRLFDFVAERIDSVNRVSLAAGDWDHAE